MLYNQTGLHVLLFLNNVAIDLTFNLDKKKIIDQFDGMIAKYTLDLLWTL